MENTETNIIGKKFRFKLPVNGGWMEGAILRVWDCTNKTKTAQCIHLTKSCYGNVLILVINSPNEAMCKFSTRILCGLQERVSDWIEEPKNE